MFSLNVLFSSIFCPVQVKAVNCVCVTCQNLRWQLRNQSPIYCFYSLSGASCVLLLKQLHPVSPWLISMSPSISGLLRWTQQQLQDTAGSLHPLHPSIPAPWHLSWWPRHGRSFRRNQSGACGMSKRCETWYWRYYFVPFYFLFFTAILALI